MRRMILALALGLLTQGCTLRVNAGRVEVNTPSANVGGDTVKVNILPTSDRFWAPDHRTGAR